MRRYLTSVALVASVSTAHAGFWTGNEIFEYCEASSKPVFVLGYVSGWLDKWETDQDASICLPRDVTVRQAVDVFCKYLRDNPASRGESGNRLVKKAMSGAWGCG